MPLFLFICLIACWSKAILESAPNSLVQLYALVIWAIPEGFEDDLAMFWLRCTCAVIFSGRCTCKYWIDHMTFHWSFVQALCWRMLLVYLDCLSSRSEINRRLGSISFLNIFPAIQGPTEQLSHIALPRPQVFCSFLSVGLGLAMKSWLAYFASVGLALLWSTVLVSVLTKMGIAGGSRRFSSALRLGTLVVNSVRLNSLVRWNWKQWGISFASLQVRYSLKLHSSMEESLGEFGTSGWNSRVPVRHKEMPKIQQVPFDWPHNCSCFASRWLAHFFSVFVG